MPVLKYSLDNGATWIPLPAVAVTGPGGTQVTPGTTTVQQLKVEPFNPATSYPANSLVWSGGNMYYAPGPIAPSATPPGPGTTWVQVGSAAPGGVPAAPGTILVVEAFDPTANYNVGSVVWDANGMYRANAAVAASAARPSATPAFWDPVGAGGAAAGAPVAAAVNPTQTYPAGAIVTQGGQAFIAPAGGVPANSPAPGQPGSPWQPLGGTGPAAALGTAGQVWTVNPGATAAVWSDQYEPAETFDATRDYKAGDLAWDGGALYRAPSPIAASANRPSAGAPWEPVVPATAQVQHPVDLIEHVTSGGAKTWTLDWTTYCRYLLRVSISGNQPLILSSDVAWQLRGWQQSSDGDPQVDYSVDGGAGATQQIAPAAGDSWTTFELDIPREAAVGGFTLTHYAGGGGTEYIAAQGAIKWSGRPGQFGITAGAGAVSVDLLGVRG